MTQSFGLRTPAAPASPLERLKTSQPAPDGGRPSSWLADAPRAKREAERLTSLERYDILDTPPEEAFDRIVRLTKKVFAAPTAFVSFIDAHRQWHKARDGSVGIEFERRDTFCTSMIDSGEPLVVRDAAEDPRFCDSPLVLGEPYIRFYAGAPLKTAEGEVIGSLCAIDTVPRDIEQGQLDLLQDLAAIVVDELNLRVLASRDSLTGVLSRREFREQAARAVSLALRHHDDLSCVLLDVDHFKMINDSHGHAAGDRVLAQSMVACATVLRETDIGGRLGGEEFAFVLPHTSRADAAQVAEKLRAAIERQRVDLGPETPGTTASFGVASLDSATRDLDSLLAHCDEALYEAKAAGRNRVSVWDKSDSAVLADRRRVLKGGRILFNGRNSTVDCTVRSLSERSAGLDVMNSAGLPKRFELEIKADDFLRRCRIISQSEKHIEVEFDAP